MGASVTFFRRRSTAPLEGRERLMSSSTSSVFPEMSSRGGGDRRLRRRRAGALPTFRTFRVSRLDPSFSRSARGNERSRGRERSREGPREGRASVEAGGGKRGPCMERELNRRPRGQNNYLQPLSLLSDIPWHRNCSNIILQQRKKRGKRGPVG